MSLYNTFYNFKNHIQWKIRKIKFYLEIFSYWIKTKFLKFQEKLSQVTFLINQYGIYLVSLIKFFIQKSRSLFKIIKKFLKIWS